MSRLDPFDKSRYTSLAGMFAKREEPLLRQILDSKDVFEVEPLKDDSQKRRHDEVRRKVFRFWPRNPQGRVMHCSSLGKCPPTATPLWGATLYDFYLVNRVPWCEGSLTVSTGSKLAEWVQDIEERSARDEIAWARNEPKPEVRHASDIGDIIESRDLLVMLRAVGQSLRDDELQEGIKDDRTDDSIVVPDETCNADKQEQEQTANAYIPPKPFDYANYPMPWPLVPFSSNPPKLESPIPYHLLPEKLIVHDPFGLLAARPARYPETDWKARSDVTHTYNLSLRSDAKETVLQERKRIADAATNREPVVLLTLYYHDTEGHDTEGPVRAAVEVTVPPPPPPPSCTPEAHLYLSPAEKRGAGNHSFVYRAEWDLPRSVFFKPTICETCVKEAARDILRKRDGKQKEAQGDSCVGRFVKRTKHFPPVSINLVKAAEARAALADTQSFMDTPTRPSNRYHTLKPGNSVPYMAYEGPKTRVHVDSVPWYTVGVDPEPCTHRVPAGGPLPGPSPPTAQVSCVAKLSIPGDDHLVREADNYQRFGPHMAEHWTGYTVARPLHDPTPMGAITPNFYGYYEKDVNEEDVGEDASVSQDVIEDASVSEDVIEDASVSEDVDMDASASEDDSVRRSSVSDSAGVSARVPEKKYFSPILLLEDCGVPIDPHHLDLDDRHECAALLLRFHHLGWVQGSFFTRNILKQYGDHAEFPLMRSHEKRFRLIDFGRAQCSKDKDWDTWDKERFDEKCSFWQVLELPYAM